MGLLEDAKKFGEQVTGIGRPKPSALASHVRKRVPQKYRFSETGDLPNHPSWPLVHYRSAVRLTKGVDPAAIFEDLFKRNGWSGSWRDGVYDYLHYHSAIHEVMGVARGSAVIQFGGRDGRKLRVKAGDVVVLPAGTGHERMSASDDFLVVGAYPSTGKYDVCKPTKENYAKAARSIPRVVSPRKDPVYGADGKLTKLWKKRKAQARKSL
jgi:uncharacterized protein YjlB